MYLLSEQKCMKHFIFFLVQENINFKAVFYGGLNTSVLEEMVFVPFYNCVNETQRDK